MLKSPGPDAGISKAAVYKYLIMKESLNISGLLFAVLRISEKLRRCHHFGNLCRAKPEDDKESFATSWMDFKGISILEELRGCMKHINNEEGKVTGLRYALEAEAKDRSCSCILLFEWLNG